MEPGWIPLTTAALQLHAVSGGNITKGRRDRLTRLLGSVAVRHNSTPKVQQCLVSAAARLINYRREPTRLQVGSVVMTAVGWTYATDLCILGGDLEDMQLGRALVAAFGPKRRDPRIVHALRCPHEHLLKHWQFDFSRPAWCKVPSVGILLGAGVTVTCTCCQAARVERALQEGPE